MNVLRVLSYVHYQPKAMHAGCKCDTASMCTIYNAGYKESQTCFIGALISIGYCHLGITSDLTHSLQSLSAEHALVLIGSVKL